MSDCINVVLEADRGMTLNSPNFFAVEEVLPPDADIGTIEAGILSGDYTPLDLDLYTYEGYIKPDYGKESVATLDLVVGSVTIETDDPVAGTDTYKVVTFKVLPATTVLWDNRSYNLLFDIKRTEIADPTNVDIWVKGSIQVLPVITE